MDAEGIPVPLIPAKGSAKSEPGLFGFLKQIARQSKSGPPLLALDEETAIRIDHAKAMESQPYLIELGPESLAALLRQLNQGQLLHALREGGPVEVRHQGQRYIFDRHQGSAGCPGDQRPDGQPQGTQGTGSAGHRQGGGTRGAR